MKKSLICLSVAFLCSISVFASVIFSPPVFAVSVDEIKEVASATSAVDWLALAGSVIGVFSLIAAITPNEVDNRIVDFLLKIVNILGANVGYAKNKDSIE